MLEEDAEVQGPKEEVAVCVEAAGESRRVELVWEESEKPGTAFDLMWERVT